ncbi:MAG: DUF427 domain-containing protein [Pseudomonadota bacterium]|nr:DUF427 domain-containing protein [Pseudomonadota bacterium]
MKATWNGATVAQSDDIEELEGNAYFPADSLDRQYVSDSEHTSVCPWKGTARYYDVVVDGQVNANAAWYYPEPLPAAGTIRDRVAFWKGVKVAD